ncbi:MAG: hypothetical protein AAFX40_12835 [Cyanobacteria bacterium J06639_1]
MTPRDIQQAIEGMLAVQRQLRTSPLRLQLRTEDWQPQWENFVSAGEERQSCIDELMEGSAAQQERLDALVELSAKHERRFTQFYGDRQTAEVGRFHLTEGSVALKRQVNWLERQQDES